MGELVYQFYFNGKQLARNMQRFLIEKEFNQETLDLLNYENLCKLAEEHQFQSN